MDTDKKIFQYLFLIFFAAMTGYTFLLRTAFYNEEGFPRAQGSSFRIIGENLAGDYAVFRLLEKKTPPEQAYQKENISDFLYKTAHVDNRFISFASPMKSFLSVPWLSMDYNSFCETWIFWGLVLFGLSLYTLFPITKTLLLMFALPVAFLSFTTGGWGVYAAAGVIFALSLADRHPKWAGFFAGLCIIEPVLFILLATAFFARKQKKVLFISMGVAGAIVVLSLMRYGFEAFTASFKAGLIELYDKPCVFSSLFSILYCSGISIITASVLQILLAGGIIFAGIKLFRQPLCPSYVQNAYLCAAGCLISPLFYLADFGLFYAGIAFLLKDSEQRGFLKGDILFFTAAFSSIYFESYFIQFSDMSFQMLLSVFLLFISYRRSY